MERDTPCVAEPGEFPEDEDEDVVTSCLADEEEELIGIGDGRTLDNGGGGGEAALRASELVEESIEQRGPTLYSLERIVKESTPLLLICIVLEIMGGQMLNSREALLVAIPMLLMAIPVINGVGGNIGTVLGMRFTTALHLGEITPSLEGKTLRSNLVQGLALGVISFGVLAVLTSLAPVLLGFDPGISLWQYAFILFGAGLMLTVLVVVVTITAAVYAFKFGYDPDNVVTPVVTTTCDLLGIVSLLALLVLVGVG